MTGHATDISGGQCEARPRRRLCQVIVKVSRHNLGTGGHEEILPYTAHSLNDIAAGRH